MFSVTPLPTIVRTRPKKFYNRLWSVVKPSQEEISISSWETSMLKLAETIEGLRISWDSRGWE